MVHLAREHGVRLMGPPRKNLNWQARTEGALLPYDFEIDWESQKVTCPNGKVSVAWSTYRRGGKHPAEHIRVMFAKGDCLPCPLKARCSRSPDQGKQLNLRPKEQFQAQKAAREYIDSEAGRKEYQVRSGIEGTLSQGVRAFALRRSRYWGQDKTHLQQLAVGTAINLTHVDDWLQGKPRGQTRISRFAALRQAA